ncbi:protein kinase [Actinoplanes sp. NEAU-A12]|uniref:Protein kinase n=1 Tax=Actinoplanes sandaracinus TaxID=3045177 RepID=A0ABT6WMK6_9ACTN|nr:serine/threonine-protein kinase [Actinoplanes sandaracinus]MDI6100880.1 protein kinase [Actinoplanes sandaracinus]
MPDAPVLLAGRYRLGEILGRGGMGQVLLARDETLERDVAIKELYQPFGSDDAASARRTLREARAAARISHPNVVQVYDVLQLDDRTWIVMEYVPCRSLREEIAEHGPIDPYRVARIGLDLLGALRTAHRLGVEHRDVKPANVLLAEDGRVLLTDFGIAAVDDDGVISRSDVLVGSPQFMAPERAQTGASGPAADLWSLGATLYAAVEGQAPYQRGSTMATLTALTTEEPDPPQRAGAVRPLLDGLLRKDPAARMTAEDAESLARAILDGTFGSDEASADERPAPTGLAGLVAAFRIPRPRASGDSKPSLFTRGGGAKSGAAAAGGATGAAADSGAAKGSAAIAGGPGGSGTAATAGDAGAEATGGSGAESSGAALSPDASPGDGPKAEASGGAAGGSRDADSPLADSADSAAGPGDSEPDADAAAGPSGSEPDADGAAGSGGSEPDADGAAGSGGSEPDADGAAGSGGSEPDADAAAGPSGSEPGADGPGDGEQAADGAAGPRAAEQDAGSSGTAAVVADPGGAEAGDRGDAEAPGDSPTVVEAGPAAVSDTRIDEPVTQPAVTPVALGRGVVPAQRRPHVPDNDAPLALTGNGRSRRGLVLIAATLAVVLAAGTAWALGAGDTDTPAAKPAPTAAATPATSAGPSTSPAAPPVDAVQAPPPSTEPVASASPAGPASMSPSAGGRPERPDGWIEHKDPTGFSVYVPEGWQKSQEGTIVYFRAGGKILGIDQTNQPKSNPVADWRSQADYRKSRGDFPGYKEIHIMAVDFFQKAADWEFTFNRDGVRKHVNNRGAVISSKKAYGFYWETPDAEWNDHRDDLQLVFDSFQPAK